MLSAEKFLSVVNMTQIVSIDLIVKNDKGQILLGKRKNSPAKGFYFVPGGRLFKMKPSKKAAVVLFHGNWEYLKISDLNHVVFQSIFIMIILQMRKTRITMLLQHIMFVLRLI